jgi:hypothetical protein
VGGEIMERDIITVYCLIDEYLKLAGIKDDVRAEISNAEVLMIGYMAVNDFNGNYFKAHQYVKMMHLVKEIDYTRFLRRLVKINNVLSTLFLFLGSLFQRLNGAKIYSVDSFPVELYPFKDGSLHNLTLLCLVIWHNSTGKESTE